MALLLLVRLVFHVVTTTANLLSFVLAHSLALLAVASLQLLKIPGVVLDGALDAARELLASAEHHALALLASAAHHALALLWAALLSLVTNLAGAAGGCFVLTASKLEEVLPQAKIAAGEFLVVVFGGAVEMVTAVAHNATSNCMDAMRFVIKNA